MPGMSPSSHSLGEAPKHSPRSVNPNPANTVSRETCLIRTTLPSRPVGLPSRNGRLQNRDPSAPWLSTRTCTAPPPGYARAKHPPEPPSSTQSSRELHSVALEQWMEGGAAVFPSSASTWDRRCSRSSNDNQDAVMSDTIVAVQSRASPPRLRTKISTSAGATDLLRRSERLIRCSPAPVHHSHRFT